MKRTFTQFLLVIALLLTSPSTVLRVTAQTAQGNSGERVSSEYAHGQPGVMKGGSRAQPASHESIAVLPVGQDGNWSQQASGTNNELRSVHFISQSEGWAAGANVTLLHTVNGGATWSPVTNTGVDQANGFNTVRMIDQNTVWVGGQAAAIRSINGGAHWNGVQWTAATGIPLQNRLFPASAETGWGVGPGPRTHLRHRLTSSFNITTVFNEVTPEMNDVYFISADQGWSVGNTGQVIHIASDTLSAQSSGTTQALNGVCMRDANTGWIVGNNGTILKTTNGGGAWTAQSSGTTAHLRDVSFADAQNGWAVGDGGTILGTRDGGATWTPEQSGVTNDLNGVHAVSATIRYAVGADGTILAAGVVGPDFSLTIEPAALTVNLRQTGSIPVTVERTGGFARSVTIAAPDTKSIKVKLTPKSQSTTGTGVTFDFKVKKKAAPGVYELVFTGRDADGRTRTATLTMTIQ